MVDMEIQTRDGGARIHLPSRLDSVCAGQYWSLLTTQLGRIQPKTLTIDAGALEYLDGAGIALLLTLEKKQQQAGGTFYIEHLNPNFKALLENNTLDGLAAAAPKEASFCRVAEDLGWAGHTLWLDIKSHIGFLGELAYKVITSLMYPGRIRWKDFLLLTEKAGADAITITGLMGFLIGLILAFQSAVAMGKFGANVYVADLLVLSMFKEMGPLITAFILASRSGSAYAAEIGTMKVNEELDALHTLGMDSVRFLVVPRVLALVTALPLLTLFNILLALFGGQAVMALVGVPPIVFWDRCREAADLADLFSGLAKTFVFGYFIAAIGCLRGLDTGKGASAVGDAATRAVVTCIVMIVVVDGVFAVAYYYLGI
jgi:phospholipid/cholesterol/gamma-HCH transport system permease protein